MFVINVRIIEIPYEISSQIKYHIDEDNTPINL